VKRNKRNKKAKAKSKLSEEDRQMQALMKRIEEKEKAIKQKEKDELKYKNQGETWMGPVHNGPIDRGGYFYSK